MKSNLQKVKPIRWRIPEASHASAAICGGTLTKIKIKENADYD
jgi:hypothetical protein